MRIRCYSLCLSLLLTTPVMAQSHMDNPNLTEEQREQLRFVQEYHESMKRQLEQMRRSDEADAMVNERLARQGEALADNDDYEWDESQEVVVAPVIPPIAQSPDEQELQTPRLDLPNSYGEANSVGGSANEYSMPEDTPKQKPKKNDAKDDKPRRGIFGRSSSESNKDDSKKRKNFSIF